MSFPSPGDLPNPGIEPRFSALQADSLLTELQGKSSLKMLKKKKPGIYLVVQWLRLCPSTCSGVVELKKKKKSIVERERIGFTREKSLPKGLL